MKILKSKLFVKFYLIIALVIVSTLSVTGFFLIKIQEEKMISEKEKSWEHFVKYLAQTSGVYLYRYDYYSIRHEVRRNALGHEKNSSDFYGFALYDFFYFCRKG